MANPLASAPREAARHARRQALLETAEQVFAERGFDGATMAEIAARAGYSAGNLYNVFESKEALFREVLSQSTRSFHELTLATLGSPAPLSASLDRFLAQLADYVLEHRAFFALYAHMTNGRDLSSAHLDDESQQLREAGYEALVTRLRRAMASREIPKQDPEVCSDLLGGTIHRHVVRWLDRGGSDDDLRRGMEQVRTLLRRALGVKR